MKLDKFEKLKSKLEVLKLEKNFSSLNTTLYWFSFLGNGFLVYFGYFFVKTITESLPNLFPYQDIFFTIFIALFLIGYELTKRFVIEQTSNTIVSIKKITPGVLIGLFVSLVMIIGSFYLSINGAHRLVDSSQKISISIDSLSVNAIDSVSKQFDKEIVYYRSQPAKTRQDRKYRDSIVSELQNQKDIKVKDLEDKIKSKAELYIDKNKENDTAFFFMTIFLEFIIILGVAFNSFYIIGSYQETSKLLQTPKYKQHLVNLKLLKVYFNNGKKSPGDLALSIAKLRSLSKIQKLQVTLGEIKDFINLCEELEVVETSKNRRKQYLMTYDEAKRVMEKDELL